MSQAAWNQIGQEDLRLEPEPGAPVPELSAPGALRSAVSGELSQMC